MIELYCLRKIFFLRGDLMKKIVSNVLVVSSQLMIGGLFLFMLFSGHPEDNKLVVIENNNLNKMADAVSELFEIDQTVTAVADEQREEELRSAEQKAREEEEARKAQEEAARKAAEEEAKRLEAERIAQEEARKQAEVATKSFNASTGYNAYTLSDEDFNVVAGVVACEATSYEDALGVASVILNRTDSGSYPSTPLAVVAAPHQFSCYGYYLNNPGRFAANRSNYADEALRIALSGTRNNSFYSFNYVCSSPNGVCTQIGGGNWYY